MNPVMPGFFMQCRPSVKLNVKIKTIDCAKGFLSYNYSIFNLL